MSTRSLLLVLLLLVPAAACGDELLCDAADLRARLAAAAAGDTVTIPACTMVGPFDVPAGVHLEGAGDATVIVAPPDGVALTLAPSSDPSALTWASELAIESAEGCAGVTTIGPGSVALIDLDVRADRGVGIAIEGATDAQLSNVHVTGPVTAENADTTVPPQPPFRCGSGALATHGVVLVDVARAQVTNASSVDGFGRFGLLAIRSDTSLSGLEAHDNLGAGVEIWDGLSTMDAVTITGTGDGAGAVESYGLVVAGGAAATSTDLAVIDGDGYGLFLDGGRAAHERVMATDNGFAGLWAQNASGFEVTGDSRIERNAFAGVAIFDSTGASIEEGVVSETAFGVAISGLGTISAADGVHASASDVVLSGVSLLNNARVGAVLDLDGSTTADVALTDVTVEAGGMALGAIAQNGTVVDGWDDGVMRLGSAAANDAAFAGALEIAQGIGPPCLPPLDSLELGGIADLVTP